MDDQEHTAPRRHLLVEDEQYRPVPFWALAIVGTYALLTLAAIFG